MNYFNNISKLVFDLGGTGYLANKLNTKPSTISNWKKNNKIPHRYHEEINAMYMQKNIFTKNNFNENNSHNNNFKILIIISGGIACYKSLELIRTFKKMNFVINVVLTNSAKKFINPFLITSLNGKKCFTDLFLSDDEEKMSHIQLARENDLILVAPATANTLGKLANGIADDLASTVLLATNDKIIMVPSMNPVMWLNPACQNNVKTLKERGIKFIEPAGGLMACGEEGIGRFPDIEIISNYVLNDFRTKLKNINHSLQKKIKCQNLNVIVTAGPTQEQIDPIRFISNHSSGKQGYAIAEEFVKVGATVTLITGPTNTEKPVIDKIQEVKTADEMLNCVLKNLPADIFVCAAAVADWKLIPFQAKGGKLNSKIKKKLNKKCLMFKTTENPDILKTIGFHNNRPKIVVGFAAETDDLIENAKSKLKSKNADIILANQIDQKNQVFGSDFNKVSILEKNKLQNYEKTNKQKIAKVLVEKIIDNYI